MPTPTSAQRGPFKKCQGKGWACTLCPATRSDRVFFRNLKAALNHGRTAHKCKRSVLENDKGWNEADGTCIVENGLQALDETCWDKIDHPPLTSEGLRQWEMHAHVDHVFDLVPFWQRGIDAAAKGEVLRLEEFLERMEGDGGWKTANEVLGMLGGWKVFPSERPMWDQPCRGDGTWGSNGFDWSASQRGGWGVASTRVASDTTESSRRGGSGWGLREEWAEGGGSAGAVQDSWAGRVKTVQAVRSDDEREGPNHFVDAIARQEAVNEERRKQMHLFFEMPMEEKIQKIEETIRFLRTHTV